MPSLRTTLAALALAALATGCFGDWGRARTAPDREAEPRTGESTGTTAPEAPCEAYLSAVIARCDATLDGVYDPAGCHGEIVRVMDLLGDEPSPRAHRPRRAEPRETTCARYSAALPEPTVGASAAPLGPQCRAWADAIRERCVVPLSGRPPRLGSCGPELLAFESILGAITFGRASDFEPQCRSGLALLRSPPTDASRD